MVLHLAAATRVALRDGNWYSALALALTLPDICGRLESPSQRSQARYEAWWNSWVEPAYATSSGGLLGGGDAYALRCAVLHEGRDDILAQKAREAIERFIFVAPTSDDDPDYNLVNGVLVLRVDVFCLSVCAGVDEWSANVRATRGAVANRSLKLMKIARYPLDIGGIRITSPTWTPR